MEDLSRPHLSIPFGSQFSQLQLQAINEAKAHRNELHALAQRVNRITVDTFIPHTYICSEPGFGKTHTVSEVLENSGLDFRKISGKVTLFSFAIQLAVLNYNIPAGKRVVIFVDDCEGLLSSNESLEVLKGVLFAKTLCYTTGANLESYDERFRDAIAYHQNDGPGFTVPTDRFLFIFTSNVRLPSEDKTIRDGHLKALKDRFHYRELHLSATAKWGIAMIVLAKMNVSETVKCEIAEFTWEYKHSLLDFSIRLIQRLVDNANEYPEQYRILWEANIKNS